MHYVSHNAPVEYKRPCSCYFQPEQSLLKMTAATSIRVETSPGCWYGERVELLSFLEFKNLFKHCSLPTGTLFVTCSPHYSCVVRVRGGQKLREASKSLRNIESSYKPDRTLHVYC